MLFTVIKLLLIVKHRINHGTPKQIRMSKALLPIALETAMSPMPFFATKRLLKASGTLAPKAINVIPITVSGIENVYPFNFKVFI